MSPAARDDGPVNDDPGEAPGPGEAPKGAAGEVSQAAPGGGPADEPADAVEDRVPKGPSVVDDHPLALRMVGASMVGLGALLQAKSDPEAHWSEPHKVTLVTEVDQSAGPGPDLDYSEVPDRPPADPRAEGRRPKAPQV